MARLIRKRKRTAIRTGRRRWNLRPIRLFPVTDIIIEHREQRFLNRHKRILKKLRAIPIDPELDEEEMEIPGDLAESGDWEQAARAAAERPGVGGRIGDVFERLIAQGCVRRTQPLFNV